METRLLEYFVTVAAEESITDAAAVLGVAQSSVSVGVRNLENELGVSLFQRTTRSLKITLAGEQLLPQARKVLHDVERFHALVGNNVHGLTGRLRLGTFTGLEAMSKLPEVLAEFGEQFPGIDVTLCASNRGSTGLQDELTRGRIDVAFMGLPPQPGLESVELFSAAFIGLLPPNHPLVGRDSVTLAELAGDPWVDVMQGYGNRIQLERALRERGLSRHVTTEVTGVPTVPSFVARGIGVAVVPDLVPSPGCVRVNITDALPRWQLQIAVREGELARPIIAEFVAIFRRQFHVESRPHTYALNE